LIHADIKGERVMSTNRPSDWLAHRINWLAILGAGVR
jgi:hypothetical protein